MSDSEGLVGEVYASELQGAYSMLYINFNEDSIVHVRVDRQFKPEIGDTVQFEINPQMVRFFDPKTEKTIRREVGQ